MQYKTNMTTLNNASLGNFGVMLQCCSLKIKLMYEDTIRQIMDVV